MMRAYGTPDNGQGGARPRIYFAGPDVFAPDWPARKAQMKSLADSLGATANFPVDGGLQLARAIVHGNLDVIDASDAVVANLTPFRGAEPDSGTVFEVAQAFAKRKVVVGWSSDFRPMVERIECSVTAGVYVDCNGWMVENFRRPLNIMLAETITLSETIGEAITTAIAIFKIAEAGRLASAHHPRRIRSV